MNGVWGRLDKCMLCSEGEFEGMHGPLKTCLDFLSSLRISDLLLVDLASL